MSATRLLAYRRSRFAGLSVSLFVLGALTACQSDPVGPSEGGPGSSSLGADAAECTGSFAILFDGVGDHVDLSPDPLGTPVSVTVEAWLKLDEVGRIQMLVTNANDEFNDGFTLWVNASGQVLFTAAASTSLKETAVGTTALETGRWYHVAGTHDADAGLLKVFVDGVEDAAVAYGDGIAYAPSRDLRFGMQKKPLMQGERYLAGTLDEVRLWSGARVGEEIATAMESVTSGDADGLAGYWRMDEGEGEMTADGTSHGNTGFLRQGASWTEGVCNGPRVIDVVIDVKPGDDDAPTKIMPNPGSIPVAVLSSPELDVVAELDRGSLTFGATGDEEALRFKPNGEPGCGVEDVNADGLPDLVCHFEAMLAGFQPGDTEAVLKGMTRDGGPVEGSEAVEIL